MIGRKLVFDKAAGMNSAIADIEAVIAELSSTDQINDMAVDLQSGLDNLKSAVAYILENVDSSHDFTGSVAVNFLMLTGTVFGAWQMARASLAVLSDAQIRAEFRDNKIATTRFYMKHVLPRANSYRQTIEITADDVMSIPVNQL